VLAHIEGGNYPVLGMPPAAADFFRVAPTRKLVDATPLGVVVLVGVGGKVRVA
jgi:hypothetical protein